MLAHDLECAFAVIERSPAALATVDQLVKA
jgi:hypothetical protein